MCAVRTGRPAGSIKAIITMCSLLFCYKKLFVSDNRCHAPPWRAPPCCCSPSSSPRHLAGRWTQVSTSTQGILNIQLLFNKVLPMYLPCFHREMDISIVLELNCFMDILIYVLYSDCRVIKAASPDRVSFQPPASDPWAWSPARYQTSSCRPPPPLSTRAWGRTMRGGHQAQP